MRGAPGSGKSYKAKTLVKSGVIFSTDDFFYVDGIYQFDLSKIQEYHQKNQKRTEDAMKQGISPIVVDNTNTTAWEMKRYVNLADQYGYKISLETPDTEWAWNSEELAKRNTHGVPKDTIDRMLARFQHEISLDEIRNS
jgi:NEDD4-binding protein 2